MYGVGWIRFAKTTFGNFSICALGFGILYSYDYMYNKWSRCEKPSLMASVYADVSRLLESHATRATSRELLETLLKQHQKTAAAPTKPAAAPTPPPVPLSSQPAMAAVEIPFKPIAKYVLDQSAKFVKVYITLPGIESVTDEHIRLDVHGGGALTFEVTGLPASSTLAPNARLAVHALHSLVDPANSSWARKADSVVLLKMRKEADGEEWGSLDDSAHLKAKRREQELAENKGKSTQELLSKMYADADEAGKASLAQAWETGRAKREWKS